MFRYIEDNKGRNRHMEFVRSIFVDDSEALEAEKKDDFETTLDELLAHIFDEEG